MTATLTVPSTTKLLPVQNTVQPKLLRIIDELNAENFERQEITWSMIVAVVAHLHLLMVGPGGTAKSKLTRDLVARISDAKYFETALDETSTPDQVLGPPDIQAMVEDKMYRRVPNGMLPTASVAFIDEFFNGNGPVLHSIMPLLNERIFHNGGEPATVPLLTLFAGTNKLNADQDQAALWDRIHIRHQVGYVKDRDNRGNLLRAALRRQVSVYRPVIAATVTVAELRAAHDEAMELAVPQVSQDTFLDLVECLERQGVTVSTRRQVEGLKAVVANAWLAGHGEVKVGDLSILQHMFWSTQEQIPVVKTAILTACNPGEQQALDMLDDLDRLVDEYKKAESLDPIKRSNVGMEQFKKVAKILKAAEPLRDKAVTAGASTLQIDRLIEQSKRLKMKIGTELFNFTPDQIDSIKHR